MEPIYTILVYTDEMSENDDESLEAYWGDLGRVIGGGDNTPEQSLGDLVDRNDFVIGTSRNRILVVIKPDGTHYFGPEYTPSEAATTFWEEMGRRRLQMEERLLLINHMEGILSRIGTADLRCEALRRQAQEATNPVEQQELLNEAAFALQQLEATVNQGIELGRALVRRPGVAVTQVPQQIPRILMDDPNSSYLGQAGLPYNPADDG